jgi:hypothetical protein
MRFSYRVVSYFGSLRTRRLSVEISFQYLAQRFQHRDAENAETQSQIVSRNFAR